MSDLFDDLPVSVEAQTIARGAVLLRGFARPDEVALLSEIDSLLMQTKLRHMQTPGGYTMSVASSSCGSLGWVSDARGYRYTADDPLTGQPWPAMPLCFSELAERAAAAAGYPDFVPESCLINQYEPGAKLSLHQDRDEKDLSAPIVSVSLGLPAVFLFVDLQLSHRPMRHRLVHGDVVVWGGPARLAFHGVAPLEDGEHALLGRRRVNLTFRRVNVR